MLIDQQLNALANQVQVAAGLTAQDKQIIEQRVALIEGRLKTVEDDLNTLGRSVAKTREDSKVYIEQLKQESDIKHERNQVILKDMFARIAM